VAGKDDRVLGTDAAARRAALLAVVLLFDEDAVERIDAVHAEQAEVDALHAVRAAAVVDNGIPAALDRLGSARRSPVAGGAGGPVIRSVSGGFAGRAQINVVVTAPEGSGSGAFTLRMPARCSDRAWSRRAAQ
jgi:hypothetical protein